MLGRMSLCQATDDSFAVRSEQEWQPFLQDTFGIFQNSARFDVILRFSPERSRWVRDEVWHEGQSETVQEDGSLVRIIPASHEAEIMMEILKHGSHVEVLEPEWLREKVVREMKEAVQKYSGL